MKVFRDKVAYVQLADLWLWSFWKVRIYLEMPECLINLLEETEAAERDLFLLVDDPEGVEALHKAEWIDDFDEVEALSDKDVAKRKLSLTLQATRKYSENRYEAIWLQHRVAMLEDYLSYGDDWELPWDEKPVTSTWIREFFEFI